MDAGKETSLLTAANGRRRGRPLGFYRVFAAGRRLLERGKPDARDCASDDAARGLQSGDEGCLRLFLEVGYDAAGRRSGPGPV